jgi:hypothetical protein
MKLKVYTLALAAAVGCGTAVRAQQQPAANGGGAAAAPAKPEAGLPTADAVFDNYIKAVGGKEALAKFKSRVSKGTVEIAPMGATGTVEFSQVAPGKSATLISLTGLGAFRSGYDGAVAWSKDPFSGLRELKGGELNAARRGALLDASEWKKLYTKMTVTGRGKVGEREVYVVEAATSEGDPDKMYFDAQSGLLLRMDSVIEGPQGRIQSESYMDDYREVDGVKMAHTTRQVIGATTITIRLNEVKHDAAVDASLFKKPAA